MYKILGIPNCSTVRKARKFIEDAGYELEFRDIRKEPLTKSEWEVYVKQDSDSRLINTKSPSFKKLEIPKESLTSIKKKVDVLIASPTAMKRPLLIKAEKVLAYGFEEDIYKAL